MQGAGIPSGWFLHPKGAWAKAKGGDGGGHASHDVYHFWSRNCSVVALTASCPTPFLALGPSM